MKKLKKYAIAVILIVISFFIMYRAIKYVYPLRYENYVLKYSNEYNIDPYLVTAVIKTESGFKHDVKSHKNAIGLMQLTEETAVWIADKMKIQDFKIEMLQKPEINIAMGCWYLDNLKEEFKGDVSLILAAYNGGRGNVQKWLKDTRYSEDGKTLNYIPFKETDRYVKRVEVNYKIYKTIYRNLNK